MFVFWNILLPLMEKKFLAIEKSEFKNNVIFKASAFYGSQID